MTSTAQTTTTDPCTAWCTDTERQPDHGCSRRIDVSPDVLAELYQARDDDGQLIGGAPQVYVEFQRTDGSGLTIDEASGLADALAELLAATGTSRVSAA